MTSQCLVVYYSGCRDNGKYNQALCHHSIVWRLFGDKHQNLMRLRGGLALSCLAAVLMSEAISNVNALVCTISLVCAW